LAVQTDYFASREWCRREVLAAKRFAVPMVVLNAVQNGEPRSCPYLGNVPSVRWKADNPLRVEDVVGSVLREVLRCVHFLQAFDVVKRLYALPETFRPIPYPPELLTGMPLRGANGLTYVYPDPPIGAEEYDLLKSLDSTLRFCTPTEMIAYAGRTRT
jgi:hypothetical protein